MLNPQHLRTLVLVVRTGSFADAARQLGYTGSAVSQQISALERAVKLPLFERSARSVRPTPAAVLLAERAQDALASIVSLEDELMLMREGQVGRLRIGSFPTASQRLLPLVLAAFLADRPLVEITLDEAEPDELIVDLEDGKLDIALIYRYDLVPQRWSKSLPKRVLFDEDLVLLLPEGHPLIRSPGLRLHDLAAEKWISTREGTAGATCLTRMCAAQGFAPTVVVRSNDYDTIHGLVRSGLGIALVPALSHVESEGVCSTQSLELPVRRHVFVQHRTSKVNPVVTSALAAIESATGVLIQSQAGVHLPGA